MKKIIASVLGLLIACGHATAEVPQKILVNNTKNSQQNTTGQKHPFFSLLGGTKVDYRPLPTAESIQLSEVIVRGHIVSISAGRTFYPNNGFSNPMGTVLIKMGVSHSLKGPYTASDFVYFEYLLMGIPINYLNKNKYKEEILVLLRTPTWDSSDYTMVTSKEGLMHEIGTLYRLTSQRALLIEEQVDAKGKTRISQPLDEMRPLFIGQSFAQLEKEISTLSTGDWFYLDIQHG